jgi:hypothetical protein
MNATSGCLADTSFLISVTDQEHVHFEDARFLFEKLVEYRIPIYVSVSARSEYIDFMRRLVVTESLMDMLAPSSKWKISSAVREVLRSQKGWIDNQARSDAPPYLTDARIKLCKQSFLPKNHSGQIGWVEFCREYLSGRLHSAWSEIVEAMGLNYVDMRSTDSVELFQKPLQWEAMYRLAEESALGSQDAMILNLLDSSVFPFVVTMDFDLAYGVMLSTKDKSALVPDNLYRNRLRKLKF